MRKPRLTKEIVDGLEAIWALADVNQFEDSDLYAPSGMTSEKEKDNEVTRINRAVKWLGDMISWYHQKHQETKRTP